MTADPTAYRHFAGLVFDCDGTLADTMPAHYTAWRETAARHGLTFPEPRFYALGGVPAEHIVRLLADEQGVAISDPAAVAHEKEQAFAAHLESVAPIEPVLAIAQAYRGVTPMAVATGGMRWLVERSLRQLEVFGWFDALIAAEDVTEPKPAAETYERAAAALGVPADRCCAFEDSEPGLASAREAGMTVVDIRELRAAEPDGQSTR